MAQPNKNAPDTEPLSPSDFQIYNRLAEAMQRIHNEFRITWNELKAACSPPPPSTSNPTSTPTEETTPRSQFLASNDELDDTDLILQGLSFTSGLSNHHAIEERFLFPVLAERMPEFSPSSQLHAQHEIIHDGLVKLGGYLRSCERDETGVDRVLVRGIMDGFEEVLWAHLEREVEVLGAENMRGYWGVEEVGGLRI